MARIEVPRAAREDLDRLIETLSLPADTRQRVRHSIAPLARFPRAGVALEGRIWHDHRLIRGPWRWLLVVYRYDEETDRVVVITFQDARSSSAATHTR